eukprot:s1350_g5.t1
MLYARDPNMRVVNECYEKAEPVGECAKLRTLWEPLREPLIAAESLRRVVSRVANLFSRLAHREHSGSRLWSCRRVAAARSRGARLASEHVNVTNASEQVCLVTSRDSWNDCWGSRGGLCDSWNASQSTEDGTYLEREARRRDGCMMLHVGAGYMMDTAYMVHKGEESATMSSVSLIMMKYHDAVSNRRATDAIVVQ